MYPSLVLDTAALELLQYTEQHVHLILYSAGRADSTSEMVDKVNETNLNPEDNWGAQWYYEKHMLKAESVVQWRVCSV